MKKARKLDPGAGTGSRRGLDGKVAWLGLVVLFFSFLLSLLAYPVPPPPFLFFFFFCFVLFCFSHFTVLLDEIVEDRLGEVSEHVTVPRPSELFVGAVLADGLLQSINAVTALTLGSWLEQEAYPTFSSPDYRLGHCRLCSLAVVFLLAILPSQT